MFMDIKWFKIPSTANIISDEIVSDDKGEERIIKYTHNWKTIIETNLVKIKF